MNNGRTLSLHKFGSLPSRKPFLIWFSLVRKSWRLSESILDRLIYRFNFLDSITEAKNCFDSSLLKSSSNSWRLVLLSLQNNLRNSISDLSPFPFYASFFRHFFTRARKFLSLALVSFLCLSVPSSLFYLLLFFCFRCAFCSCSSSLLPYVWFYDSNNLDLSSMSSFWSSSKLMYLCSLEGLKFVYPSSLNLQMCVSIP